MKIKNVETIKQQTFCFVSVGSFLVAFRVLVLILV